MSDKNIDNAFLYKNGEKRIMECKFNQQFDSKKKYQYVNNEPSVLHCHHYSVLFTKLALDTKSLNGPELLIQSMEESTYLILKKYFITENIVSLKDKISMAEEYFRLMGLGKLKLKLNEYGASATMPHAHIDEGWLKKFGKQNFPVNFIGHGYLAGALSAINGKKINRYKIKETKSIVRGDTQSEFVIEKK